MIHLTIPESDNNEKLIKMKQQYLDIADFAEYTYLQTQWAKTNQLSEKVQNFVDMWRTSVSEQQLNVKEKTIYFTLIGAVFNQLQSYSELSTYFLTQAIRFDQQNFFAYYQLGIASTKAQNYRRAELMFNLARRFAPAECLSDLLSQYSQLNRLIDSSQHPEVLQKALQLSREAVEMNPNSDQAWFSLGLSLLKTQRSEADLAKAGQALRKAIQLRESLQKPFPDCRFNYGMLLKMRLEFQQAWEQFKKAYEEDSSLQQAQQQANVLEDIAQQAMNKCQGRQIEPCVFSDPMKGIFGLVLGHNKFGIQFRILAKLSENAIPAFYLLQTIEKQNLRAIFCQMDPIKQLEVGAVVQLSECSVKLVQLKTKTQKYEFLAINNAGQMLVNGVEVTENGAKIEWKSEVK